MGDLGTLDCRGDLVRTGVLIERHRDRAEPMRGADCSVQARPVVAEQRDIASAVQSTRRESGGKGCRLVSKIPPRDRAPDAAALFAEGRVAPVLAGVAQ